MLEDRVEEEKPKSETVHETAQPRQEAPGQPQGSHQEQELFEAFQRFIHENPGRREDALRLLQGEPNPGPARDSRNGGETANHLVQAESEPENPLEANSEINKRLGDITPAFAARANELSQHTYTDKMYGVQTKTENGQTESTWINTTTDTPSRTVRSTMTYGQPDASKDAHAVADFRSYSAAIIENDVGMPDYTISFAQDGQNISVSLQIDPREPGMIDSLPPQIKSLLEQASRLPTKNKFPTYSTSSSITIKTPLMSEDRTANDVSLELQSDYKFDNQNPDIQRRLQELSRDISAFEEYKLFNSGEYHSRYKQIERQQGDEAVEKWVRNLVKSNDYIIQKYLRTQPPEGHYGHRSSEDILYSLRSEQSLLSNSSAQEQRRTRSAEPIPLADFSRNLNSLLGLLPVESRGAQYATGGDVVSLPLPNQPITYPAAA